MKPISSSLRIKRSKLASATNSLQSAWHEYAVIYAVEYLLARVWKVGDKDFRGAEISYEAYRFKKILHGEVVDKVRNDLSQNPIPKETLKGVTEHSVRRMLHRKRVMMRKLLAERPRYPDQMIKETDLDRSPIPERAPGLTVRVKVSAKGAGKVSTGIHNPGVGDIFAKKGHILEVDEVTAQDLQKKGFAELFID